MILIPILITVVAVIAIAKILLTPDNEDIKPGCID